MYAIYVTSLIIRVLLIYKLPFSYTSLYSDFIILIDPHVYRLNCDSTISADFYYMNQNCLNIALLAFLNFYDDFHVIKNFFSFENMSYGSDSNISRDSFRTATGLGRCFIS